MNKPILYSFRRCPYAMRARLALEYAGIDREHREILLRDKPSQMLEISPKGTVPVLQLPDGTVIDESLDIMLWALSQNDPDDWLSNKQESLELVQENDSSFKQALDRYKYANRFPEKTEEEYRADGELFLRKLENRLSQHTYLLGNHITLADMALFPFVRQFAKVDFEWFESSSYPHLLSWLQGHLSSPVFEKVMIKHDVWKSPS